MKNIEDFRQRFALYMEESLDDARNLRKKNGPAQANKAVELTKYIFTADRLCYILGGGAGLALLAYSAYSQYREVLDNRNIQTWVSNNKDQNTFINALLDTLCKIQRNSIQANEPPVLDVNSYSTIIDVAISDVKMLNRAECRAICNAIDILEYLGKNECTHNKSNDPDCKKRVEHVIRAVLAAHSPLSCSIDACVATQNIWKDQGVKIILSDDQIDAFKLNKINDDYTSSEAVKQNRNITCQENPLQTNRNYSASTPTYAKACAVVKNIAFSVGSATSSLLTFQSKRSKSTTTYHLDENRNTSDELCRIFDEDEDVLQHAEEMNSSQISERNEDASPPRQGKSNML